MKCNEAYMIPAYKEWGDTSVMKMQASSFRTPYRKHWRATVQRLQKSAAVAQILTADAHVDLKVNAAITQIESRFSSAGKFLREELLQMKQNGIAGAIDVIQATAERYIDTLWMNCAKDYMQLGVFNYLEGMRATMSSGVEKVASGIMGGHETLLVQFAITAAEQYIQHRNDFRKCVVDAIEDEQSEDDEEFGTLEKDFASRWKLMLDSTHRMKIQGTLDNIRQSGYRQYVYVCNNAENTCEACAALDGQTFNIEDAVEGINLPPIHPNCRCTISGHSVPSEQERTADLIKIIAGLAVISIANRIAEEVDEKLSVLANKFGLVWSVLFEKSIWDYYGTFTTIEIDGVEYHINRNNFTAVAIGPDGKLIVPENAKLYDEQLLELMKQRDALPEGSAPRVEIEAEIQRIYSLSDKETRSVNPNKPYEFYVLGEDVTERLNEYMRQTEADYAHMHKRYWAENLKDFYLLVRGKGKMDLKAQPEWQHSAYIYDGELVSQDALGNINYGYFGAFCNIPKIVLVAAGGVAQWLSAGKPELEFWYTFFDDPRDAYRVMQGIAIYNSWH